MVSTSGGCESLIICEFEERFDRLQFSFRLEIQIPWVARVQPCH